MRDKNARPVLEGEHAFRCGDVLLECGLRLLHHADVVTVLDENIVDAAPAGTIGPGAVNENNIVNAMLMVQ